MEDQDKEKERGHAQAEDEEVIASNELLKAIRERMRTQKKKQAQSDTADLE